MTKPHTITPDELIAYLERERWERYASSATPLSTKWIEISNKGKFRVMVDGSISYCGHSLMAAVCAYNEG